MMVSEDITKMYNQIIAYLDDKIKYLNDPVAVPTEFVDFTAEFDLNDVVYHIQRQIPNSASLTEAGILKAFRDIRAAQAEYDIRLMDRKEYFTDAAAEEADNKAKWEFNQKIVKLHMDGKDVGA